MQNFTQRVRLAGWLGLFLLMAAPAWAQFTTATQDGTINAAAEYNNNGYQTANGGNNGGAWYISWDDTNLYLAKDGGNSNEPAIIYLDTDPVQPVTDTNGTNGGNSKGNLNGKTDYNTTPQLPFRADVRIYTQGNYVEYSYRDGNGGWDNGNTTNITLGRGSNEAREIAITWNAATGNNGRPASFNWLAFQTNTNNGTTDGTQNYRYDQAPGNPSSFGNGNATPPFERYFTVVSTNSGYYPTAANDRPTNVISFTAQRGINYDTFNAINAWDLTMDSPGRTLSRTSSSSGTDWTIGGSLVVSAGTLNFGSTGGSGATTTGNLLVTGSGTLNMNGTDKRLDVTGATATTGNNVQITNGGTLILSTNSGGGLALNGNFTFSNGSSATSTFTPNTRTVSFVGSANQTITGPTTGTPLTFDKMAINTGAGIRVQLASNIRANSTITFTQGILNTVVLNPSAPYTLDLAGTGSLSGETDTSNLTGFVTSTQTVGAGGSGQVGFGNTGLILTPVNSSAALGSTTVTRSRGVGQLTGAGTSQSINRNFRIVPTNTAGPFDVNLQLGYLDTEYANTTQEGDLQLFYSNNAVTYPASGSGTFTRQYVNSRDQAVNYVIRNDETMFQSGIVYTLADNTNPLPVTLVSFVGRRVGSTSAVRLNWLTASEKDNAGFTVERQLSATEWQAVTFVPGTSSSQGHSYEFVDGKAPAGQLYYRLRQADLNGTTSYSRVVTVAAAGSTEVALSLSPVPTPANQAALTVDLSAVPASARTLTIFDLQGREVVRATAAAEASSADLPVAELAAGTYVVQVRTATGSFRTRFVKL